ncbi:MAG: hypothetical protein O7G30_01825, partial [Proteobacteria bacterium]|nr:hypothetical protein [Pseudomonadota bacterium]
MLVRQIAAMAALLLAASAAFAGGTPAIARPGLAGGTSAVEAPGLVFFLAIESEVGAVAVGTAHTFPISEIASAGRVDFFTGKSLRRVATSSH